MPFASEERIVLSFGSLSRVWSETPHRSFHEAWMGDHSPDVVAAWHRADALGRDGRCVVAGLVWGHRLALMTLLGLGLLTQQALLHRPWSSLAGLVLAQQATLERLNVSSVGTLLAFLALVFAG